MSRMFRFGSGSAYGNVIIVGDQSLGEILSVEIRAKPVDGPTKGWMRRRRRRSEGNEEEELVVETLVATSVENNRR